MRISWRWRDRSPLGGRRRGQSTSSASSMWDKTLNFEIFWLNFGLIWAENQHSLSDLWVLWFCFSRKFSFLADFGFYSYSCFIWKNKRFFSWFLILSSIIWTVFLFWGPIQQNSRGGEKKMIPLAIIWIL